MCKQLNSNSGQMMHYLVEITETHVRTVVIYAQSPIFDDLVYIEDKEHDAYRAAKAERKGS